MYTAAADAILILHALFVAFVIFGLLLILAGGIRGWLWVRNFWFLVAHLLAIGVVVLQSWLGILCPLTSWEMALRERAGETAYDSSFVAHCLQRILFYQALEWVFIVSYTLFAALVLASWFWIHPRS